MPIRSTTQFAPILEGYPEPEQQRRFDRLAQQMKTLGHVDANGFRIPEADPTVTDFVGAQADGPDGPQDPTTAPNPQLAIGSTVPTPPSGDVLSRIRALLASQLATGKALE